MKALADLKRLKISTVPLPDEDFEYQPLPLGKASRHGLHAVAPMEMPSQSDSFGVDDAEFARAARSTVATNRLIRPSFGNQGKVESMTTPKLTTDEFIQVRLATVRESTRHCYWPSDVVARFAAADVIR